MAAAWDTTLVSQIRLGSPAYLYCLERLATPEPVIVTAGAVIETAAGWEHALERRPEFQGLLDDFKRDVAREAICRVLALDGAAAFVAGQLLGRFPAPPTRKGDKRAKSARRRAWQLDIEIAATCWAAGYDVASSNRVDFEEISAAVAGLYPGTPPLEVEDAPF